MSSTFSASGQADTPATSFTTTTEPVSEPNSDPFNLQRFIKAQDRNDVFNHVISAIREGTRKPKASGAWMWFTFQQMDWCRTGTRPNHPRCDIWIDDRGMTSLDEARAILRHPVLGPRIRAAAQAVLDSPHVDRFALVNNKPLDVARVRSSMTIFRQAARYPVCIHDKARHVGENIVFRRVLDRYFVRETDSEDDSYDDDDDEEEEEPRRRRGHRHPPTLRRLDRLEAEGVAARLASPEGRCVCGKPKAELDRLDDGSRKKIELAQGPPEVRR